MSLPQSWLLLAILLTTNATIVPSASATSKLNECTLASSASLLFSKPQTLNTKPHPVQSPFLLEKIERLTQQVVQLTQQGKYAEAIPIVQQALAVQIQQLGDGHPDIATSLNYLATSYQELGLYSKAAPLYQQALSIYRCRLGNNHPHVATNLNNLAGLYQDQGRYSEAELLHTKALTIRRQQLGDDHPHTATSLNNLATLYQELGRYSEAEPLYMEALAIRRKQLGDAHFKTATSLNSLARLYQDQGRYSEAELFFQQALSIYRLQLGSDHPDTATGLNNLAAFYDSQQRYEEAEPLYNEALAIRRKRLGDNHPDTADSLNNLAGFYHAQGNIPQAVVYRERGTEAQENNLEILLATGSERRKRAYIATVSDTTNATLSLHLQDAPNNAIAGRLALITLLRRKGRVLDASSSSVQTLRQNLVPTDQNLLDELNNARAQLANLIFKGPGESDPGQYRQQVAQLKGQTDQLESQLSQRSAQFRVGSQLVTIEAVQQQIPTEAALVELVQYKPFNPKATGFEPKWDSPRYAAYVLQRQGDPKWVDLGDAEAIDKAAFHLRKVLGNHFLPRVNAAASKLDELLMQPIRPLLGQAKHLLIAPDSQLNLIPFAALQDEQGRFLVEQHEISYLTSGRDLLKLQLDTPSRQAPVLLANADFDNPGNPALPSNWKPRSIATKPQANQLLASELGGNRSSQRSTSLQDLKFGSLPATQPEADAIAPLLPGVIVLTKDRATENAVKQVQGPSVLHIATHGFFLPDVPLVAAPDYGLLSDSRSLRPTVQKRTAGYNSQPALQAENPLLRSALALAGFNLLKSGEEDGALTALEASGLDLYGTQLVVLSACQTGLGDVANGEGVYGLRRALVLAGARSQVISLWFVDDEGTKDWMVDYYQRLKQGVGRSAAVRQVQLQMLQDSRYQHPYYWAAFIHSGDWRPMTTAF